MLGGKPAEAGTLASSVTSLSSELGFKKKKFLHTRSKMKSKTGKGGEDGARSRKTASAPVIVAKQISEFPISRVKFSPYHTHRLVSCGKENIRFFRIRRGHLPGCPVILNEYARDRTFTDLAFESGYGPRPADDSAAMKRVFVASDAGSVLQINCETRSLEGVYRLQ